MKFLRIANVLMNFSCIDNDPNHNCIAPLASENHKEHDQVYISAGCNPNINLIKNRDSSKDEIKLHTNPNVFAQDGFASLLASEYKRLTQEQ